MNSILAANEFHENWELGFGDDGSIIPGRPIVEDILKDHLDKVKFVRTENSIEEKLKNGISHAISKMANEQIKKSDSDVAIILCDDDELHPEYLKKLSNFYDSNPDVKYAYSKVHIYNPLFELSKNVNNLSHKYNDHIGCINPVGKVDSSQVSWRLSCCSTDGAWFNEDLGSSWLNDTDKGFFDQLYLKCGDCHPTNIIGQYKGIHDYQLVWNKSSNKDMIKIYDKKCRELAGVLF